MRGAGALRRGACVALFLVLGSAGPGAAATFEEGAVPLPPLRPIVYGGPDPVADWSDPEAPLEASPPKPAGLGSVAATPDAGPDEAADEAAIEAEEGSGAGGAGQEGRDADAASEKDAGPAEAEDADAAVVTQPTPDPEEPAGIASAEALADERPAFDEAAAERCEDELRQLGATFSVAEPIDDNGCGAERPLLLDGLPGGIALDGPNVLLRCEAALAVARWADEVVQPSARLHLGTEVETLVASTSYFCRGRAGSGTPSQHAFANALDVLGLRFADDSAMLIAPRPESAEPRRAFQAAIRGGACAYFTTVLGPTTDAAHADHLHLDVKRRSSGYRVCE